MLLQLGRGMTPAGHPSVLSSIDLSEKTVALFGDSITSQNTTVNDQEYLPQGYMNMLNAITGQRYYFPPVNNLGASGDSLSQMYTRRTDLAGLSDAPDLVFVLGGSNDIPAATTEASMKTSLQDIYDYITGTLGAKVVAMTIPPRTLFSDPDSGEPLTTTQQTKLDNVNSWIMAKSGDIIPVNIYNNLVLSGDDPYPDMFSKEGSTGTAYLHPNPLGALQMAKDLASVLNELYGTYDIPDMTSVDNLLSNDNLSGTGGTNSSSLSGSVADSNTFYAYAAASGTLSKPTTTSQEINISYTNSTSFDTVRFYEANVTSGYTAGDDIIAEAEIEVLSGQRVKGLWVEVTDTGGSAKLYKGLSKYDEPEFPTEARTYYLQSPLITTQGDSTALSVSVRAELNSESATTATLDMIVKQVRCRVV